jgi:NADPH:quinone reductase and related Zn-dependent oxidoreductases
MKAILCKKYGPPNVLELAEVSRPKIRSNQILVKVKATAVNSADVRIRELKVDSFWLRLTMRFVLGFFGPRRCILGSSFSGIIEEMGNKVSGYQVGQSIFGSTGLRMGAYAEYLVLPMNAIFSIRPTTATFEEAAALPFGGATALHFYQKTQISIQRGLEVLVYGATGSVGVMAVEIAKYYGAIVTSVCSREGEPLARKLGSDEIIIYTDTPIARISKKFDIVFDAVGLISKKECNHLLKDYSKFLTVGGLDMARETKGQLILLRELFDQKKIHANIDREYPFDEIIEAHSYVDTGRKKGNVIIKVD